MSMEAIRQVTITLKDLEEKPGPTVVKTIERVNEYSLFLHNYALTEEEAADMDQDDLDCNDHTQINCEKLQHMFPMYKVLVWPKEPEERLRHVGHVFSACKFTDGTFLICDNLECIHWHGTLAQYVAEYQWEVPMHMYPIAGITRFREMEYRHWTTEILGNLHFAVQDETSMQVAPLPIEWRRSQFAQLQ